jgi:1,2-diacylglycerol-3-alpha-glucose alpha-1,2-glucosyltransferase
MANRFPDLRFMWVGGMFYKGQMQNLYGKLSSEVRKALSSSDIFVFPSHHETQGLALVEAAANCRPIVTRDLPVFREWLTHGVDCLMGTDMDEFESHIRSLSQDISFASEQGKHALQSARKHHDIDKTSQSLAKIYN